MPADHRHDGPGGGDGVLTVRPAPPGPARPSDGEAVSNQTSNQERDAGRAAVAQVAQFVVKELREKGRACEGEAAHVRQGGRTDGLLIAWCGQAIVRAHCEGLLDGLLDLDALAPVELLVLGEEHLAAKRAREERAAGATATPPPAADGGDPGNPGRGGTDAGLGDTAQPAGDAVDPSDLAWQHHVSRVRLDDLMLKVTAASEIGAGGRDADEYDPIFLAGRVVIAAWSDLSERFPGDLTPEAARVKNELLPGVDPWFGGARGFVKAAWVCQFLADRIERVWAVLTPAEAERASGINLAAIWRAAKNGNIEVRGKVGKQFLLLRSSFEAWAMRFRERKKVRTDQKKAARSAAKPFKCTICPKQWSKDPGLGRECPACHEGVIYGPKRRPKAK